MRRMKKTRFVLAFVLLLTLIFPQGIWASGQRPPVKAGAESVKGKTRPQPEFREGQIIFKSAKQSEEAVILKKYKLSMVRRDSRLGYTLAAAPKGTDLQGLVEKMALEPAVRYVQPNFVYKLLGKPNDPLYGRQWAMPKINAEQGWGAAKANAQVTIAILDSGIDVNHPDLKGKLVQGINTVNPLKSTRDDDGHGTHVAGIAGAVNNNSLGVTGVAGLSGVRIMPIKVFDRWGASDISISDGIIWAADHGARVMNMSFGSYYKSEVLNDAIDYAYGKGVVMVAAAGNWAAEEISYPAALSKVIAVSATDKDSKLAGFSSYGPQIDVCAPGDKIYSAIWDPYKGSTYSELSGTSMASPMVTGLAALLLAKNPKLTTDEVRQIIEVSATDLGDKGWDPKFGHGLINVHKALTVSLATSDDGNSTLEKAVALTSGQSRTEKINSGNDVDWYKIQVPEGNNLQVEVLPAGKVSPGVEVCDAQGETLAAYNTPNADEEEPDYSDYYWGAAPKPLKVGEAVYGLLPDMEAGDYYIKVFGNHFRWTDDNYTVTARLFTEEEMVKDPNGINDSFEKAKPITHNKAAKGAILFEDDEDWFKLRLEGNSAYKIQVDVPAGLDLAVDVESEANYKEPASEADWERYSELWYSNTVNNAGQGADEEGIIITPRRGAGVYFLRVYDNGGNTVNENYSLQITKTSFTKDRYEPNDSQKKAVFVNLGDEVAGNFHANEDEDWYKVQMVNDGILKIKLKQPRGMWCAVALAGEPEFGEETFDTSGGLADLYLESNQENTENQERTFEFKVTRGVYYINIYNFGDISADNYTFKTEFSLFDFIDLETNDRPSAAQQLQLGTNTKGTIYPENDLDIYTIDVEKPGAYLVYLTPPKDLDSAVVVLKERVLDEAEGDSDYPEDPGFGEETGGPREPLLEPVTEINTGLAGQPDTGVFVTTKPGTYYVAVLAADSWEDEQTNAKSTGAYNLLVKPFKSEQDKWENNNTMSLAKPISSGVAVTPTYMGTEDADWFKINVSAKGRLAVNLAVPNDIDGVIEIYDSAGKLLAKADQSMVGEVEGAGVAVAKAGTYYIKTYDYLGNSSVQTYTLTAKFTK